MVLLLALVCAASCFGGLLLGQSLKANLVMKQGLEKAQKTMFAVGAGAVALALVLALAGLALGPSCGP